MPVVCEREYGNGMFGHPVGAFHRGVKTLNNASKFWNRPAVQIYRDISRGYDQYPFSVREMLKAHGSEPITSLRIVRTPLSPLVSAALRVITWGEVDDRIRNSPYDHLFHLKVIVNNRYSIEKQRTLSFTIELSIPPRSDTEEVNVGGRHLTIQEFLDHCAKVMGKSMFSYDFQRNNCQHFVANLLRSNGFGGHDTFILQDIPSIFERMHGTRKIVNSITDVGNRSVQLQEGRGI